MRVDPIVQVDLSDQAPDFRRLALQPGMGLLDRSGRTPPFCENGSAVIWLNPSGTAMLSSTICGMMRESGFFPKSSRR